MDKDRVEGVAHQAKGSVKEAAGKMTGDKKTEAEVPPRRRAGKVQNAAGGVKDAVKDRPTADGRDGERASARSSFQPSPETRPSTGFASNAQIHPHSAIAAGPAAY